MVLVELTLTLHLDQWNSRNQDVVNEIGKKRRFKTSNVKKQKKKQQNSQPLPISRFLASNQSLKVKQKKFTNFLSFLLSQAGLIDLLSQPYPLLHP
jgi:hypothetical protein